MAEVVEREMIASHVRQYPVRIRIVFLQGMLLHYAQLLEQQQRRDNLRVVSCEGWQAAFMAGDRNGFTLDGWIEALWESL